MKIVLLSVMLFFNVLLIGQIDFQLDIHKQNQLFTEHIREVAIDSIGYLWLGTFDGVIRYDGHNIDRFQNEGAMGAALNGNRVNHILSRPDSSVWVGTYGGGISIYQPINNNFKTLLSANHPSTIQENRVTGIHALSDEKVLIHYYGANQKSNGFSILDKNGLVLGHHLQEVNQDNGKLLLFNDVAIDQQNIWIPAQKLYQVDRRSLSFKTIEYPFPVKLTNDVKAIDQLDKNTLIIGTKKGIYTYHIQKKEWTNLLPNVYVKVIKSTKDKIYILCAKQIYFIDKSTGNLSLYLDATKMYKEEGFRMNDIQINKDDFWLASNKGLFRFEMEEQPVKILRITPDQNQRLLSIKKIKQSTNNESNLYIAYGGQIVKSTNSGRYTVINETGDQVHGMVSNLMQKDQYVFATNDGLFSYYAKTNKAIPFIENTSLADTLKGERIWSVYNNGQDAILWIGTQTKGLFKYDISKDSFVNFTHEVGNPYSLCFDRYLFRISPGLDGNLWISTNKGLSVINPTTNQFVYYPKIMDLIDEYIVHHNVAGDHYMWIGTRDHGLFRYDIEKDEVKTYTIRDGLPFTGANRVIFDKGNLYFSTIKGVCILKEATDKIRLFDEQAGIDHGDMYKSKLNIEGDYLMVSGGISNKIYKIPIDDLSQGENLNPILIESIKTNTSDTSYSYNYPSDNIHLSAIEDNLLVTFTNVDFDRRRISYRYKLDGYDERWISTGASRIANYSHLSGGSYQLIVQASLAGGSWEQESTINIQIDKFWYRTWWFYALCTLISLLTFGFLYKLSLDKVKLKKSYELMLSQAEMKALKAQMNPHFMFNSLNSIKSFIIENDRRNAADYLNKFSKLMRLILNHSESNLTPLSEEIDAIKLYIDMEQLRFSSFVFELEIDKNICPKSLLVPPMIIQPYLENAIWHGLQHKVTGQGKLLLQFDKIDAEGLHVVIRDNGVGRAAASAMKSKSALQKKSQGMTITKERLELTRLQNEKEAVKIVDLFETGTTAGTEIQILLPYTKSEKI